MQARKTFLITGGTGSVGQRLTELLVARGHEVRHLSRSNKPTGKVRTFVWSVDDNFVDPEALVGVNVIVHLAGAPIADARWSKARKKELVDSRIATLNLLKRHLPDSHTVTSLVSASAQGYYIPNTGQVLREDDAADVGWMGQLCAAWEGAATSWSELGIRVSVNRIGLVLSPRGGVLEAIRGPIDKRMSPVLGSGSQVYSWIHVDDLCSMMIFEAENLDVHGVFNAVAPHPVTQREFNEAVVSQRRRAVLTLRAPSLLLKAALGARARVVIDSFNLSSDRVQKAGYTFQFESIDEAVEDLMRSA